MACEAVVSQPALDLSACNDSVLEALSFLSLLGQALGLDLRGETLVCVFAVWERLRIFPQLLVSVFVSVSEDVDEFVC